MPACAGLGKGGSVDKLTGQNSEWQQAICELLGLSKLLACCMRGILSSCLAPSQQAR